MSGLPDAPPKAYLCITCRAEHVEYRGKCGECGAEHTIRLRGWERGSGEVQRDLFPEKARPMQYRAEPVPRIRIGVGGIDQAFGGPHTPGIATGTANLLSGAEGAGKSTLALYLVNTFPNAMYASSEESYEQIEDRASRIGIVTPTKRLGASLLTTHSISNALDEASAVRSTLLLLDSLHGFDGEVEGNALKIHRWCKANRTTVLCIVRLVKNNTVRGSRDIVYEFDSHIEITVKQDRDARGDPLPTFSRFMVTRKNRFGPTGQWPLLLTESGWSDPKPPLQAPPTP